MKPGVAMAVMIDVPHELEVWSVFSSDLFDRKFMILFKKLVDEDTLSGMVQPDNDSSSPLPAYSPKIAVSKSVKISCGVNVI